MPSDIGYGTSKEKGVRNASASAIPPKGISSANQNGSPPTKVNDKPAPLPPSNSSPDFGAAKATTAGKGTRAGAGAPKRQPDKSKKIAAPLRGQRMRERATKTGSKGTAKKRSGGKVSGR